MTRLVVDLGDPPSAGIRGRLAEALGDPSLELAYWLPETRGYVDESGRPVQVPAAGTGRAVTPLELEGERVGALVHDAAVFDDARLLQAVAAAAQIALANVRLQADVRRHLADLEAIPSAAPRDLRMLRVAGWSSWSDKASAASCPICETSYGVLAPDAPSANVAVGALLTEAQRELEEAQHDLERLASGVRPPVLAELGLGPALAALAGTRAEFRFGCPWHASDVPDRVETAIYFIFSEAIANVQKYAKRIRCRHGGAGRRWIGRRHRRRRRGWRGRSLGWLWPQRAS